MENSDLLPPAVQTLAGANPGAIPEDPGGMVAAWCLLRGEQDRLPFVWFDVLVHGRKGEPRPDGEKRCRRSRAIEDVGNNGAGVCVWRILATYSGGKAPRGEPESF